MFSRVSVFILSIFYILLGSTVYASTIKAYSPSTVGAMYTGVFGGGGGVITGDLRQQGTAFYDAFKGGALAVNAKGKANNRMEWLMGGHLGYRWPLRNLNHVSSKWFFSPATELEGYYLSGSNLQGEDLNNDTRRLVEHSFHFTYPMHTSVFFVNAVLNTNPVESSHIHPYVGAGVGSALISISGADSTQTIPQELNINHYNSEPNDSTTAFAAQSKFGVSYHSSDNTTIFIEYRFLYLSATDFTFGSAVYPTHVVTSNWDVKVGSQYYNMGTIGLQYDL